MELTSAQVTTLRTDITVTRASTSFQGQTLLQHWNAAHDSVLAAFYNQTASPQVNLWRPDIPRTALSNAMVMSEFIALTVAKQNGWFALTQTDTVDATLSRVRQNFIDVFGGASTSMVNLTAAAQKPATYLEALLSASGGAPGTGNVSQVYGYILQPADVAAARV